jgi:NADPH-dependent curcumin reductase CurA
MNVNHHNRQIVIAELPVGRLRPRHFRLVAGTMPVAADGQVLLRVRYALVDAAMRAWMLGPTYRSALKTGDVMAGAALCEVVESRDAELAAGDLVYAADAGWRDYVALPASQVRKLGAYEPITHGVSVYGTAGLTAYFGLLNIGRPRPGNTVVVSAAAGAVGSIVGQLAKIKGCRAVGIAGGKAKCDLLVSEFGFDAAVDYKAGQVHRALAAACPQGIDIYFDNVGGLVFEAALFNMRHGGRLVACGAVSAYDTDLKAGVPAVRGVPAWFISRRLSLQGFIVSDHAIGDARDRAIDKLRGWVASGELKVREDIIDGLENLPGALVGLLAGDNVGKRMVKVA